MSNGEASLPATLDGLDRQTERPDMTVAVDGGSRDSSRDLLGARDIHSAVLARRSTYGQLIRRGVDELPEAQDDDWLWLLAHDAVPHPGALEALLGYADANPSVVAVGPKVMRFDEPDRFAEFGQTMTRYGRSVLLRRGELDQGQHDGESDVLGLAETGLLIRRDVFDALGGFDPALSSIDVGLDLGVRARLAGHRVAVAPGARVRRDGGPEHFQARSVGDTQRAGIARRAALHRRLAYAHPLLLPVMWLLILPLSVVRSIGQLLAKRPAAVMAEWRASIGALVDVSGVRRARARINETKTARWRDLRSLRLSRREERLRSQTLGDTTRRQEAVDERVGFVEGAGLWVATFAAVAGLIFSLRLVGAESATGGATLPLSGSVSDLWANTLYGARDELGALTAAADPFSIIIATLGSLTPWQPSTSIVVLFLLAPALASISGFYAARHLTRSRWSPAVAGLVWALAPTLLAAVGTGRVGAVIAHIALPLAVIGVLEAHRSWRRAGAAAVAVAVVAVSSPLLVPALVVLTVIAVATSGRWALRPLATLAPALVLLAPMAVDRWVKGAPLLAFADPGVPTAAQQPTAADIALGALTTEGGGFSAAIQAMGAGIDATWIAIAVLSPLSVAALAGVVLRPRSALVWMPLLLAGFFTAVAATRLQLTIAAGETVYVWAGGGVSLVLMALVSLAVIAIDVNDRRGGVPGGLIALGAIAAAVPLVAQSFLGGGVVTAAAERRMPAFVEAAATTNPRVGVLVLQPLAEDVLRVDVERGLGRTLDSLSTARTTEAVPTDAYLDVAAAAVDLASGGDSDTGAVLDSYGVEFVLLLSEREGAGGLHDRAERSLDARGDLQAIGETGAGLLWQRTSEASPPGAAGPAWAPWLLLVQLGALAAAAVAALPSLRRGERVRTKRSAKVSQWQ